MYSYRKGITEYRVCQNQIGLLKNILIVNQVQISKEKTFFSSLFIKNLTRNDNLVILIHVSGWFIFLEATTVFSLVAFLDVGQTIVLTSNLYTKNFTFDLLTPKPLGNLFFKVTHCTKIFNFHTVFLISGRQYSSTLTFDFMT